MSSTNYFHRKKDKVQNRETGYTNKMFLASTDDFTLIAEPTAPFTNPGDSKRITEDHTFPTTKGFIELYCAPDSVDAPAETAGDIGSKKPIYSPVGFLPGDGPDVQAMVEDLLNDDVILIAEDANCPDGPTLQFGCKCKPARIDSANFTSGTTATDGRKGWMLTFKSGCRWFYEGTVTMKT